MESFLTEPMRFVSSLPLSASEFSLGIAGLLCLSLLLAVFGFFSTLTSYKGHRTLMQRLAGSKDARSRASRAGSLDVARWVLRMLKVAGEANRPRSDRKLLMLRRSLSQAGYRSPDAPLVFFGVKLYLALLMPVVYAVSRPLTTFAAPTPVTLLVFVFLATLGFYAPGLWIRTKSRYRRKKVFADFPDALDLMVVCVEAGLSLDAAIHKVGEEIQVTNQILGEEFKLLDLGLRAGQSRQVALLNLSRCINVEEVNNFVALLIQTEQFGTSIAQALRVHADAMRLKRRQYAEERATTLPIKLLFPLLFFIFPSLFLVILGPGILRLAKLLTHLIKSAPTG